MKKIKIFYNWTKEEFLEFRDAVAEYVNKTIESIKNFINKGYNYATNNPYILVDTTRLEDYARQLKTINRRLRSIDSRINKLYLEVSIKDLWNLLQADVMTDYSTRLDLCIMYLNETAKDFQSAENAIKNKA